MFKRFFLGALIALSGCGRMVPLHAQTAPILAPVVPPVTNLYMAGASYSAGAVPAVSGSALYAHRLNTDGTYAFTFIDALPNTQKPFTVTTNVAVGIAQRLVTIDKVDIFVPTAAGVSYTGTNTGWAWSTGGGAMFNVRPNWYVMPTVRVLKSSVSNGTGYQPIIGVLFGWGS